MLFLALFPPTMTQMTKMTRTQKTTIVMRRMIDDSDSSHWNSSEGEELRVVRVDSIELVVEKQE